MNPRKSATMLTLAAASALLAFAAAQPQTPAWKPLFNDKDLTGWKHVGPGGMTVEFTKAMETIDTVPVFAGA